MAKPLLLYATAPEIALAEHIAHTLVDEAHAACVNIFAEGQSVYSWNGDTQTAKEIVFIVKTTADKANAARDRILALHPYECPCVLALPVEENASSQAFIDWIETTVVS